MWGGLGNQLFIYAFGKYLEGKYNHIVKYDFSWFDANHAYDHDINYLDDFETEYSVANRSELEHVRPGRILGKDVWSFLLEKVPVFKPVVSKMTDAIFETPIEQRRPGVIGPFRNLTYDFELHDDRDYYFTGYWQSHEYVDEHDAELREQLNRPRTISDRTTELVNELENGEYISVHFRRTDSGEGGNTSFSWYERALDRMSDEYPHASYVVFSNDISWVKERIKLPDTSIFVDHTNHRSAAEDIHLMSRCDHNIVAASTFSWWGAYLNNSSTKTVIAPRYWGDIDVSVTDKCPESWDLVGNAN